jgi:hypothetical protein
MLVRLDSDQPDVVAVGEDGNWAHGQAHCNYWGGDRATIDDAAEEAFVSDFVAGVALAEGTGQVIVGYVAPTPPFPYEWDAAESLYTNWADGEPGSPDQSSCVRMFVGGAGGPASWDLQECATNFSRILCEDDVGESCVLQGTEPKESRCVDGRRQFRAGKAGGQDMRPQARHNAGNPSRKDEVGMSTNDDIVAWLHERHEWIQEAAHRLLTKGALDESDVSDFVGLIKNHVPAVQVDRKYPTISAGSAATAELRLDSIGPVVGIDALNPNTPLHFGSGNLTVVYGKNGSGKSGYTRIITKACGAPHSARRVS